jgi:hypothetical protein
MNGDRNSFWRVVVFNQYNLALLGAAAAFSVALASRWPLLIAGTGELIWISFATSSRRVRRWTVRQLMEQDRARRVTETASTVAALDPAYATRVRRLEELGADIRRLAWERELEPALLQGENRLEAALAGFIRMAALHQQVSRFSRHTDSAQLETEVMGLGQSLASERDLTARGVLAQALAVAHRRFEQQESLENELRLLSYRMGTVEMSLDYLRAHIFAGGSERDLALETAQLMEGLAPLAEAPPRTTAMAPLPMAGQT